MHGITSEPVENYLYSLLPQRDDVLAEIEGEAAKRNIPIVGPAVGRVLHQLALISGAKNIFEMGSAIGYSTIWWARAAGENGRVIYTDGDRKNADQARGYFERAGVAHLITVSVGDALESFQRTRKPIVDSLQDAAHESLVWFEHMASDMALAPIAFAYRLMTRSGRIDREKLRRRDPAFVAAYENETR